MTQLVIGTDILNIAVPTASHWLAFLQEPDETLQSHALNELLKCVDTQWPEVAEALPFLEELAESGNKVAAAVASRVFFYLREEQQALRLALEAGDEHLDLHSKTPYSERLVAAAFDAYIAQKNADTKTEADISLPEEPLQALVHKLLHQAVKTDRAADALGIALEAREVDLVTHILHEAPHLGPKALEASTTVVTHKAFRNQVLEVVAAGLKDTNPQLKVLVHQLLKQAEPVSQVLNNLLISSKMDDQLLGLQLCFDLVDTGDQTFVTQVAQGLDGQHEQALRVLVGGFSSELALSLLHKNSNADRLVMETLKKSLEERGSGGRNSILHNTSVMTHSYLYAGTTNDSFLRDYLDWMKKASNWAKFSATASLGVVHAGHITEAMNLLAPYLPTEPADDGSPSAVSATGGYAEGGSLYALGLIHGSHAGSSATKRKECSELLRKHLRHSHANEVMSHGAALGVGLTAMGCSDIIVVNELKELLYTDSAVAGEAAGISLGMVLVGSGAGNATNSLPPNKREELNQVVIELKNYARETQHEKIIRGISTGLALIQFGQEDNADAVIEEMRSDRDPILRYGAQYALALAYCGTGSNKAIRILLHTAVSDVSDDVRMAAVIGLAFILYKTPDRVPQLVKLLLESFNPHVRYASCMAVGIAMAGTGDSESIALLEPMLDDMTDYVRQGALIGTAMIYMQQSDSARKIRSFRERLSNIVRDKHQSTLTKMGAILSKGIIDAGGRNCSLVMGGRFGFTKMSSAIGMALWLQHWHWFPMMHMFSLALTPTFTIGLNKDLKFPKSFEVQCNSKPSAFAYPKKLEEKKEEKKKRVETVTLSTTAKNKARLARKKAREDGGESATGMDLDESEKKVEEKDEKENIKKEEEPDSSKDENMDVEVVEEIKPAPKKREPSSFRVKNPARITKAQSKVCVFDLDQRYRPIRSNEEPFGVVILTDSTPTEEDQDLGAVQTPSLEGECVPPKPFEWTPPVAATEESSSGGERKSEA